MHNKNITFSVLEKIETENNRNPMFYKGQKILVGLSGGADSTALVCALKELSGKYGFELYAVHVNHMIRGGEADRDEEFSKSLCERLGIRFFCEQVDIPALSKKTKQSCELCARNERYRIFESICTKNGFDTLATAHNANDCAETMLINLIRGSALKGLCGVPQRRKLSDTCSVQIIRPLLTVMRAEIEDFLRGIDQDFVTDSTNLSDDYTRNYVRHEILPKICRLNPSFLQTFGSFAEVLRKDSDYLEKIANVSFTSDINELRKLDLCIRNRIILKMYRDKVDGKYQLEKKHLDIINRKIDGDSLCADFSLSLPKVRCVAENGILRFTDERARAKQKNDSCCFVLENGLNLFSFGEYLIYMYASKRGEEFPYNSDTMEYNENVYKLYNTDYICSDKIIKNICVRNRIDGDKLEHNGLHKSVKRMFCEKKIPIYLRNTLPFVCVGEKIAYVPFLGVSDGFRNRENSFVIKITVYAKISGQILEE